MDDGANDQIPRTNDQIPMTNDQGITNAEVRKTNGHFRGPRIRDRHSLVIGHSLVISASKLVIGPIGQSLNLINVKRAAYAIHLLGRR